MRYDFAVGKISFDLFSASQPNFWIMSEKEKTKQLADVFITYIAQSKITIAHIF